MVDTLKKLYLKVDGSEYATHLKLLVFTDPRSSGILLTITPVTPHFDGQYHNEYSNISLAFSATLQHKRTEVEQVFNRSLQEIENRSGYAWNAVKSVLAKINGTYVGIDLDTHKTKEQECQGK